MICIILYMRGLQSSMLIKLQLGTDSLDSKPMQVIRLLIDINFAR